MSGLRINEASWLAPAALVLPSGSLLLRMGDSFFLPARLIIALIIIILNDHRAVAATQRCSEATVLRTFLGTDGTGPANTACFGFLQSLIKAWKKFHLKGTRGGSPEKGEFELF